MTNYLVDSQNVVGYRGDGYETPIAADKRQPAFSKEINYLQWLLSIQAQGTSRKRASHSAKLAVIMHQ
jgi:hypothetical protein